MPAIRIHLLRCGTIELSRDAVFGGRGRVSSLLLQAAAPRAQRLALPCFSYLIEHPKGLILVDAGVGRVFSPHGAFDAAAARSLLGTPFAAYLRPWVESGQSIGEQLSAGGKEASAAAKEHPAVPCARRALRLSPNAAGACGQSRMKKRAFLPEDALLFCFFSLRRTLRTCQANCSGPPAQTAACQARFP